MFQIEERDGSFSINGKRVGKLEGIVDSVFGQSFASGSSCTTIEFSSQDKKYSLELVGLPSIFRGGFIQVYHHTIRLGAQQIYNCYLHYYSSGSERNNPDYSFHCSNLNPVLKELQ
jgi:hypothetical protein